MTEAKLEFIRCLETGCYYNQVSPEFKTADILSVDDDFYLESPEGYGSIELRGNVTMSNGDRYAVDGWCDTTGWDCQSGMKVVKL